MVPQFEILPAQPGDFGTQRRHFLVKLCQRRHRPRRVVRVRARFEQEACHYRIVLRKAGGEWKEQRERKSEGTTGWTNLYWAALDSNQ